MKCALIIPAWRPEEIFPPRTAGSQVNYWQPLGTLYVAACLERAGHEVRFFDGAFLSHEQIVSRVSAYGPGFAGIYSTAFGWPAAARTAADLKRSLPGVLTAAGGPYPVAAPQKCLSASTDLDAVVTGEGEVTVVEMLERIGSGRDLHGVKGTAFREGGRIVENPPRPLITDLDSIPFPARELLGRSRRYIPPPGTYRRRPVTVMITSRGCTRRCLFCFQVDRERAHGVRCRSVKNVLEEIEWCIGQGYREIKFLDDTLAADYGRAMELAREIKARRLDFTWFASACVNQVDEPLLRAFREAGCWAVLLGAESGVQRNLDTLRKGITLEQTRRAVRAAQRAGLTVHTPFIIGVPGETPEEARRTIAFACELEPDIASFHSLTPFPGTDLYDHAHRYGTINPDMRRYTYQGAAFTPYTMDGEEISRLRQEAYRRFYSRPRFLLQRARRLRSGRDLTAAAKGLRSLLWLWAKKGVFSRSPEATEGLGRR